METQSLTIITTVMVLDSIVVLAVSLVQKFTGSVAEEHFGEENSDNRGRYDKKLVLLLVYPTGFH